jgi:cytochrome P450 family 6
VDEHLFGFFSQIARVFKFKFFKEEVSQFFRNLVIDIVARRSKTGNTRKDFMQLLIQLKEKGRLADDDEDVTETPLNNFSAFCSYFE